MIPFSIMKISLRPNNRSIVKYQKNKQKKQQFSISSSRTHNLIYQINLGNLLSVKRCLCPALGIWEIRIDVVSPSCYQLRSDNKEEWLAIGEGLANLVNLSLV